MIPTGAHRISNPRQIRLEEFYQDGYMQEQTDLLQLTVGFSTPPTFIDIPIDEFYEEAINNVKLTFPNLKHLRLQGGYIYRPGANKVSNHFAYSIHPKNDQNTLKTEIKLICIRSKV